MHPSFTCSPPSTWRSSSGPGNVVLTLTGEGATGRTRTHADVRTARVGNSTESIGADTQSGRPCPCPPIGFRGAHMRSEGEGLEFFLLKYTSMFLLLFCHGGQESFSVRNIASRRLPCPRPPAGSRVGFSPLMPRGSTRYDSSEARRVERPGET